MFGNSIKSKKDTIKMIVIGILAVAVAVYSFLLSETPNTAERLIVYIILVYCVMRGAKEENILNPYYLFAPVPFSLVIYTDTISDLYLMELKVETWWFAIMNMIVYLIAVGLIKGYSVHNDAFLSTKKQLITHSIAMFALSMIGQAVPALKAVLDLFMYPSITCALKSKNKTLIVLIYAGIFLVNMNSLRKTTVLGLLIITLVCITKYYMGGRKLDFKLIIGLLIAAWIMQQAFNLKDYLANGGTFMEYINGGYKMGSVEDWYLEGRRDVDWSGSKSLFLPFMYLITPWTNLQFVITRQSSLSGGAWFIKPVMGWLQMDHLIAKYLHLKAYSNFNTFTYMAVFFKDFGYWGSVLGSAFLGIFNRRNYNTFIRSDSPLDIACYSLIAQAAIEMFFSNHYFQQSYPFTIVLVVWLYRTIFNYVQSKRT